MVVILNVNIITKKLIQTALTYSFECAELKAELFSQHATTAYRSLNLPKHSQADKDYKLSVFSEVEGLLIGKRWLLKWQARESDKPTITDLIIKWTLPERHFIPRTTKGHEAPEQ